MSLILVVGLLGLIFVVFLKRPIIDMLGKNNRLVQMLNGAKWFQNYWMAGVFLFISNAVLFLVTILVLLLVSYLLIPFVHLIIMFVAVLASIMLWVIINKSWEGTKVNRLKMAAVGSSFYFFASLLFIYWFVTLEPSFPGEDTFMRAVGLVIGIFVTVVAFCTCFVFTGIAKIQKN